MVVQVMTAKVPDSMRGALLSEALEWAKGLTKYLREKWPETRAVLLTNVNGELGCIHWMLYFQSMAEQEKFFSVQLPQDKGYQSLTDALVATETKHGGNPFLTQITMNFYNVVDLG